MQELQNIASRSDELKNWYWNHGIQRKGMCSLPPSGWGDKCYSVLQETAAVLAASEGGACERAGVAFWGPSQSGKSTFLARFIDGDCDEDGNGSALQWDADQPVRFSGELDYARRTVLNPFNLGSDATGCVTRFVLRDEVKMSAFPVELKLASEAQLMHALAVGYLSQTTARDPADNGQRILDGDYIRRLTSGTDLGAGKECNREAFEVLLDLVNTLGLLRQTEHPRYFRLRHEWDSLRQCILESSDHLSHPARARELASLLLWDNWPNLSTAFQKLRDSRAKLQATLNGRPLWCSLKLAAQILNISSVVLFRNTPGIRSIIEEAHFSEGPEGVCVGASQGSKAFAGAAAFACFQGIVWEAVIPLRSEVIASNSMAAHRLLTAADVIDFPGVAREDRPVEESRLTDEDLVIDAEEGKLEFFTTLLKRGKTGSIVVTSSLDLNIDTFSLLMKFDDYPRNNDQLSDGIKCWMSAMGVNSSRQKQRILPINLVLTFTGGWINEVAAGGMSGATLELSTGKFHGLGILANPQVVSTFATNYAEFPKGTLQVTGDKLKATIERITSDEAIIRQFKGNTICFEELAGTPEKEKDGGRTYFLNSLVAQIGQSRRQELLAAKAAKLANDWQALIEQAKVPSDNEGAETRQRDLSEIREALVTKLDSDPSNEEMIIAIARELMELLHVRHGKLDPVNSRTLRSAASVRSYCEQQLVNWQETLMLGFKPIHLDLADAGRKHRFIGYLLESVQVGKLTRWITENLAGDLDQREALESRRLLATWMSNAVLHGGGNVPKQPHRAMTGGEDSVASLLSLFSTIESEGASSYREMPHYISQVKPFLDLLAALHQQGGTTVRVPQPGDREFSALLESISNS